MENQPMTQAQRDMQMAALNREYRKKSNEINRKKDELIAEKSAYILHGLEEFSAKRERLLQQVTELRIQGADIAYIRDVEHAIANLKQEKQLRRAKLNDGILQKRLALDDEARRLTDWYETEKETIMSAL